MKLLRVESKLHYLRRHAVSGIYWVSVSDSSHPTQKRLEVSTGERTNKTAAESVAQKLFRDWQNLKDQKPKAKNERRRFKEVSAEVVKEYADSSKRDQDTKDKIAYIVSKHLDPYFGEFWIDEITAKTGNDYINDFHKRIAEGSLKKQTLEDKIKYFNKIMAHSHAEGYTEKLVRVENPDPKEAKGRALDESEQRRLLEAATGDDSLKVNLALCHALRPEEVLGMEYDWIGADGVLRIPAEKNKNRKLKEVPLHPEMFAALMRRKATALGKCVFPNRFNANKPALKYRKAWKSLKKRAEINEAPREKGGPGRLRFDDLRHTWLTQAAKNLKQQHEVTIQILTEAIEMIRTASKEESLQVLVEALLKMKARKPDFGVAELCTFAQHSITVFQKKYLHLKARELKPLTNMIPVKIREAA